MKNLSEVQRAYLAGFIDGEGTIAISQTGRTSKKGNRCYTSFIRAVNTDKDTLDMLCRWTNLGYVRRCYTSKITRIERFQNCKPLWRWQISPNEARQLLPSILPYLHLKRTHALIAIELLGDKPRPRGKNVPQAEVDRCLALYKKSRRLNKRGL